jgi:hypothetical protein
VSVTDLTVRAAWIVGLSLLALLCVGWRKTARATARVPRGIHAPRPGVAVHEIPAPSYRRTPIWRRIWALGASAFLTVLTGAIIAIVVAYSAATLVTTMSDLLKK